MDFTYDSYMGMIALLKKEAYSFADYSNWQGKDKVVILRHDIDNDIAKALELAKVEKECGVKSTYFVLVTSDFYNPFSKRNAEMLKEIIGLGHDVGLHFDEVRYPGVLLDECKSLIVREAQMLSLCVGENVRSVSMHRPSKNVLESDLQIPGIVNSYGKTFFNDFKYISDSRRRWRECAEDVITCGEYKRLHILTHAFWYNDVDMDIHDSVAGFVNRGNRMRYEWFKENITGMEEIMGEEEVKE